MRNRRSNWQIIVCGILTFAVWFGVLPIYPQIRKDGKGVGVKIVSELPSKEKRWALIVGIDEYQNDVSTLKGSVNDAKALKNVLVDKAGFPENQIVLLTTDSSEPDKRPTRENILGALSDLYSRVPEDGLLLFSFSGHGISVGNQAFLVPSNGRFTKNPELLQDFSIDVSRIKRAIETMKVKQVLMLLDACRNEPGKGDVPNRLTDAYKNGFSFDVANSDVKAFATLYATSIGERAYEFYDKDTGQFRGYFSHAVEEALKGKAANDKDEVTLSSLINYLETTVPKKVKWDKGETQIPSANYSETYRANQLILSVAKKSGNNSLSPAQITWNNFLGTAKRLLKYQDVMPFREGLASIRSGDNKTGKSGVIDKSINEIISTRYDSVYSFSEGLAAVRIGDFSTGKAGFIDKTGKVMIPISYDSARSFSEGLAVVGVGDYSTRKYGFIDKTGKIIIPISYEQANPFSEGVASVTINGKLGFINKSGEVVIPFIYSSSFYSSFSEGLAPVAIGGKVGFIDKSGREVISMKYDKAYPFSEGLAGVKIGSEKTGKYGFIDKTGKMIVPAKYDSVSKYSELIIGLSLVEIGDDKARKYGLIDKAGNEIVKVKYDDFWCFAAQDEGFFGVTLNGKKGFVDLYGNEYFDF